MRHARRGYTLIEMLLVVGLVVTLLALAWPAMRTRMARQRLESAAHDVRSELAKARLGAISSGKVWEVRYARGEGKLRVTCAGDEQALAAPTTPAEAPETQPRRVQIVALPTGICFSLPAALSELAAAPEVDPTASDATSEADSGSLDFSADDGDWSGPIRFFPDGTADDVALVLQNEDEQAVSIELEGLTGIASVGGIQRAVDGEDAADATR